MCSEKCDFQGNGSVIMRKGLNRIKMDQNGSRLMKSLKTLREGLREDLTKVVERLSGLACPLQKVLQPLQKLRRKRQVDWDLSFP